MQVKWQGIEAVEAGGAGVGLLQPCTPSSIHKKPPVGYMPCRGGDGLAAGQESGVDGWGDDLRHKMGRQLVHASTCVRQRACELQALTAHVNAPSLAPVPQLTRGTGAALGQAGQGGKGVVQRCLG